MAARIPAGLQGCAAMPDLYGISSALIALATGVHQDTARRYKRTGKMPRAIAELLTLRLEGELELLDPAWRGFRLVRGELWTPANWPIAPGEILALPFRYQQIAARERRAREILERAQLEDPA